MKKILLFVSALGLLVSCLEVIETNILVESVTVDPSTYTLRVGGSTTLTATVVPGNATDRSIVWNSSDAAVVSVDDSGNVKANKLGSARITATSPSGKSAQCLVTVEATPVSGVTVAIQQGSFPVSFERDSTFVVLATIAPSDATDKTVEWYSSPTGYVEFTNETTTATGSRATVRALKYSENRRITIGARSKANSLRSDELDEDIRVALTHVDEVAIVEEIAAPDPLEMGDTFTLAAEITPGNATYQDVTWKSNNTAAAKIDANGVVTIVGAGEVDFTATVKTETPTKSATSTRYTIARVPATSITFSPADPEQSIGVGAEITLTATVLPENATDKFAWSNGTPGTTLMTVNSTDPKKVVIRGLAAGTSTITASTSYNGVDSASAAVDVSVVVAATNVEINEGDQTGADALTVGGTFSFTTTVEPTNANQSAEWSSSDEAVATVDENGVVSAISVGTAQITVKYNDTTTDSVSVEVVAAP